MKLKLFSAQHKFISYVHNLRGTKMLRDAYMYAHFLSVFPERRHELPPQSVSKTEVDSPSSPAISVGQDMHDKTIVAASRIRLESRVS